MEPLGQWIASGKPSVGALPPPPPNTQHTLNQEAMPRVPSLIWLCLVLKMVLQVLPGAQVNVATEPKALAAE
ncbi:MAG: hypothetical protein MJE68_03465 [Proteobacteria bacterium]|nr:hypothetical protein [Pseudomonadota bacterium]